MSKNLKIDNSINSALFFFFPSLSVCWIFHTGGGRGAFYRNFRTKTLEKRGRSSTRNTATRQQRFSKSSLKFLAVM